MRGEWGCAAPGLVPLRAAAAAAARSFDAVDFTYIPRAQNARVRPARSSVRVPRHHQRNLTRFLCPSQADALANRAMDTRASFDRLLMQRVAGAGGGGGGGGVKSEAP
jgi:hypothetical protein